MTDYNKVMDYLKSISESLKHIDTVNTGELSRLANRDVDSMSVMEVISVSSRIVLYFVNTSPQLMDMFIIMMYNGAEIGTFIEESLKFISERLKEVYLKCH